MKINKNIILPLLLVSAGMYNKVNALEYSRSLSDSEAEVLVRSMTAVDLSNMINLNITENTEYDARGFIYKKILDAGITSEGEAFDFVESLEFEKVKEIYTILNRNYIGISKGAFIPVVQTK